jgi:hypothetical protein
VEGEANLKQITVTTIGADVAGRMGAQTSRHGSALKTFPF